MDTENVQPGERFELHVVLHSTCKEARVFGCEMTGTKGFMINALLMSDLDIKEATITDRLDRIVYHFSDEEGLTFPPPRRPDYRDVARAQLELAVRSVNPLWFVYKKGCCIGCFEPLKYTDFKEQVEIDEYCLSGMCAPCQREVFGQPPL